MSDHFPRTFALLLAGPIIWALHFLFIYSVNGIACARPDSRVVWAGMPVSSWIILAASLAALIAMLVIYLRLRTGMPSSAHPDFLRRLAGSLSLLSALAVIWETIPLWLVAACV